MGILTILVIVCFTINLSSINASPIKQPVLYQGDMVLTPEQQRNGIIDPRYRWPNGVIFYELDPTFTAAERTEIAFAMSDIESKSCIRFQGRTNQVDYVFIQRGAASSGCWAYVGRIGGRQLLNLEAPGCIRRTGPGPHELMHSVGFHHEHSRQDRDDYVQILWQNIDPAQHSNFDKTSGTTTLGIPYDYLSIMQYPRWSFSMNGQDTIQPIPDNDVPFAPYDYLSYADGLRVNKMYKEICP